MSTSPLRGRFEFWVLGFKFCVVCQRRSVTSMTLTQNAKLKTQNLKLFPRLPARRREFEAIENKSGSNRTADECPISKAPCRLPGATGNKRLGALTRVQIHAEMHANDILILAMNRKRQRCSGVPMPYFDSVNPMPMGNFTGCQ